jgi:signal transduction histidine kinase
MRERALLAGGHLEIASAPGEGTTVELTVRSRGTRVL